MLSLVDSDAVIFVGGDKSVHQPGSTARAGRQGQHILNIGSWGRAAHSLLNEQREDLSSAEKEALHQP